MNTEKDRQCVLEEREKEKEGVEKRDAARGGHVHFSIFRTGGPQILVAHSKKLARF